MDGLAAAVGVVAVTAVAWKAFLILGALPGVALAVGAAAAVWGARQRLQASIDAMLGGGHSSTAGEGAALVPQ